MLRPGLRPLARVFPPPHLPRSSLSKPTTSLPSRPPPSLNHARTLFLRPRPPSTLSRLNTLDITKMANQDLDRLRHRTVFLIAAFIASAAMGIKAAYKLYLLWAKEDEEENERMEERRDIDEEIRARTTGVGGKFAAYAPTIPFSQKEQEEREKVGKEVINATAVAAAAQDKSSTGWWWSPWKLDSSRAPRSSIPVGSKVIIHDTNGGPDLIPTGHSTVPHFPRTVSLPSTLDPLGPQEEYTLLGLGVRTVSFLHFSVYVVGLYIQTSDMSGVQSRLIRKVNPVASALVPSESDSLRHKLDDTAAEDMWDDALFPAKTAIRIVPVRDTNFPHLRDGFVRAITARRDPESTKDERFGANVKDFKHLFNKGKVPQASELVLQRDGGGRLMVTYVDSTTTGKRVRLGDEIDEPRISRALWMNYLTGSVASPKARESIVDGVMDMVRRPVGTVATQVV